MRTSKGMSRQELGAILGRSEADIAAIEASDDPNLDTATIKLLCGALEALPIEFVYGHDRDFIEKAMGIVRGEDILDYLSFLIDDPAASKASTSSYPEFNKAELLAALRDINADGLNRVTTYVEDLARIDEYRTIR